MLLKIIIYGVCQWKKWIAIYYKEPRLILQSSKTAEGQCQCLFEYADFVLKDMHVPDSCEHWNSWAETRFFLHSLVL